MALLSSDIKVATLTLTNAQLLALFATPVTLVAAPGTGKVIVPLAVHARLQRGTIAYSASRNLQIQWSGDTTNLIQTISILFANGGGASLDQFFTAARASTVTGTNNFDPSNRAIQVTIQTGAITLGQAADTLKIVLLYEEITSLY